MKRLFLAIACAVLVSSCVGSETKNDGGKECCVQPPVGVVKLSSEDFAIRVADINAAWKYLGDKPAIVDFYADWCPPCRMIAPILDEIAKETPGIYVYKVNIDDCPDIARAYNVVSIPTLLFIPINGKPIKEVGAMTKGGFENIIKEHLLK